MAQLGERRCQIVFMDSRAGGLQKKIDIVNQSEYLEIRERKGANLHQLSRLASAHLTKYPFDVVYIIGGACDITSKDAHTKLISFHWSPPERIGAHLLNSLKEEDKHMLTNHPAATVVFCPLVGVDLQ